MKKWIFCFAISAVTAGGYLPLSAEDMDSYELLVSEALAYEKAKVIELEERLGKLDHPPTPGDKLELLKRKTNFDVKFKVAKNYFRTSSLRSEEVRNRLVELIKKPKIGPGDMMKLQALVDKEKDSIRSFDEVARSDE